MALFLGGGAALTLQIISSVMAGCGLGFVLADRINILSLISALAFYEKIKADPDTLLTEENPQVILEKFTDGYI